MGCDAFTNEKGEFLMEIRNYTTGEIMALVRFTIPRPEITDWDAGTRVGHPLAIEILEGIER